MRLRTPPDAAGRRRGRRSTVVLASVVCYLVMRGELRGQVDDALCSQGGLGCARRAARQRAGDRADASSCPAPPPRAGGSAPYVQVLDADGEVVRPAAEGAAAASRSPRATARSRPATAKRASTPTARSTATTCACSTVPTPGGGAVQLGRASRRRLDAVAPALVLLAALRGRHRAGRGARAAVRAPGHAAGHRPHRGGRAHRRHRGPRRAASTPRRRRGRAAGARFNTMLDTLERLGRGPAPARGRRLARAAHAGDEPAHERRGAAGAATTAASARGGLLEDVREQTEELSGADHRRDRARARRGAAVAAPRTSGSTSSSPTPPARVARRHPDARFERDLEPSVVEGLPDRLDARDRQPARQRRQVRPAGRRVEVTVARRRGRGPRPRPGRRRPTRRSSSTASTAATARAARRAPASAWRSCARSPMTHGGSAGVRGC